MKMVDPDQIAAIMDLPEEAEARTEDIASPEAVVHAVHASISGPAESVEQRDWDRLRSLFLPGAR
ncbi:MAG: nuclear transport factor 2 family protein, partial [Longimicrobiales bacterium]